MSIVFMFCMVKASLLSLISSRAYYTKAEYLQGADDGWHGLHVLTANGTLR